MCNRFTVIEQSLVKEVINEYIDRLNMHEECIQSVNVEQHNNIFKVINSSVLKQKDNGYYHHFMARVLGFVFRPYIISNVQRIWKI